MTLVLVLPLLLVLRMLRDDDIRVTGGIGVAHGDELLKDGRMERLLRWKNCEGHRHMQRRHHPLACHVCRTKKRRFTGDCSSFLVIIIKLLNSCLYFE